MRGPNDSVWQSFERGLRFEEAYLMHNVPKWSDTF